MYPRFSEDLYTWAILEALETPYDRHIIVCQQLVWPILDRTGIVDFLDGLGCEANRIKKYVVLALNAARDEPDTEFLKGKNAVMVSGITTVGKFCAIAIASGHAKLVSGKRGQRMLSRASWQQNVYIQDSVANPPPPYNVQDPSEGRS